MQLHGPKRARILYESGPGALLLLLLAEGTHNS